jgi:hypothetical protein
MVGFENMGYRQTGRAIRRLIGSRRAFIELTLGPALPHPLILDDHTVAYPLLPIGNSSNIDFGISFLELLRIPTDDEFRRQAEGQGQNFHSAVATVYSELSDEDFDQAATGKLGKVERYRALLAVYVGGEVIPFARIKKDPSGPSEAEFLGPKYRGVARDQTLDAISPAFVRQSATEFLQDDQLHYYISILEQTYGITDQLFRIARLYSLLETIAGGVASQFKEGGSTTGTRTAIRFVLGYFRTFDIPRFTLLPDKDFEFDHIELAGRVRDRIFHGGGELVESDVPAALRPSIGLLKARPDIIAHQLRKDCELEISRWASKESIAWKARNGETFKPPVRDPNYNGRSLLKPLLSSSPAPNASISSVFVQVRGLDIGAVRLDLQP